VIFPFEQEFYRRHGVEVSYVGHPLAYAPAPEISREEFAAQHGLDPQKQWIALLPGSRRKEVRLNLPPMLAAAAEFERQGRGLQFLLPVASTLDPEWVVQQMNTRQFSLQRQTPKSQSALDANALRLPSPEVESWSVTSTIHLTDNARATLMHARAAVVASGTATVEAALSGTPFVVVYRLAPLTWLLGRRLVKLDTFAMPNLIAGEKIVTELIQKDFTAANVVRELDAIIPEGPRRQQMQTALKTVQQRLHDSKDAEPPARRAAAEIMRSLERMPGRSDQALR
jgi:lipid-A-disaccharide synthase